MDACCGLASLSGYNPNGNGQHVRIYVTEIRRGLETVYITQSEGKTAENIDFEHFGRRVAELNSKFDLALLSQRWRRDLFWDHLAELLRSVGCSCGRGTFFVIRVAVQELGASLEARAPAASHGLCAAARARLRSWAGSSGQGSRPAAPTRSNCTGSSSWPSPSATNPSSGPQPLYGRHRSRRRRGADLHLLAEADVTDRGARDIWETLVAAGRRTARISSSGWTASGSTTASHCSGTIRP